jgi:hypothetical protein
MSCRALFGILWKIAEACISLSLVTAENICRNPKELLYANVLASAKQDRPEYKSHVDLDDGQLDRLRKAQEEFRGLAARMRAFALNEPFAVRLVKWCGYDPLKASSALLSVSNTINTYGLDRAAAANTLPEVLHFRTVE